MKVLAIASANLQRLFRDRSNIFFVLILPVGIILLIGAQFGGGFEPKVGVVSEGDGAFVTELVEMLEAQPAFVVRSYDDVDALLTAVERGTAQAGVVIPADHDQLLRSGGTSEVGFVARADGVGQQLRSTVDSVINAQASRVRAARVLSDATATSFDEALGIVGEVDNGLPRIGVATRTVGEALFPATMGQFDLGASSQLVLFMFLTGLTGSAALIQSRTLGVSTRMLSTPTKTSTIILGEALGRYAVVLVQGVYIMALTLVVFQVEWGDPLGAVAILLTFGAVAAGTAMLMGTLFRNDQQAGGIGVMAGLGLAALGGCMVPIEIFPETMRTVAHFTPHAWALDGFADLVRRDGTFVDVLPEVGVVTAFAVVIFAISAWRYRKVLTAR